MSVFALVLAWLMEQLRPLPHTGFPKRLQRRWARMVAVNVDTGQLSHARMGWMLVVLVPGLLLAGLHWALAHWLGSMAAMLLDAVVLYLCLGWRRFTGHFMAIRNALAEGEDWRARQLLAAWQGVDVESLPASDISRHAIEYAVLAAHRQMFAIVLWYAISVLLGLAPFGALMYRNAEMAMRYFRMRQQVLSLPEGALLAEVSERVWPWIDWLPARVSALVLALVGNSVAAMRQVRSWAEDAPMDGDGLLLASASGALNLRLGERALAPSQVFTDSLDEPSEDDQVGVTSGRLASVAEPGRDAEVPRMEEVMHWLWRALGVWLLLVVLLSLLGLL